MDVGVGGRLDALADRTSVSVISDNERRALVNSRKPRHDLGPGKDGERRAECEKDAVRNRLVSGHLLHCDERHPENRAEEIGGKEAQDDVTPSEPSEPQT